MYKYFLDIIMLEKLQKRLFTPLMYIENKEVKHIWIRPLNNVKRLHSQSFSLDTTKLFYSVVTLVIFGMPIYAHKKGLHNKFEDNLKLFYMHQMSFIPEFILEIVMPIKNNYINLQKIDFYHNAKKQLHSSLPT